MLPPKITDKDLTMLALIANWLSFVRLRYPDTTYKTYRTAITNFIKRLPKNSQANDVTPPQIENYLQALIEGGRAIKTANTYLAALKSFYKWAETYYEVDNKAKAISPLREGKKIIRVLSDKEYKLILSASLKIRNGQRDRGVNLNLSDVFQFLGNTGLRINEFFALRWPDFGEKYVCVNGKGGKSRSVPLNTICLAIIGRQKSYSNRCQEAPPFVKLFLPNPKSIYIVCRQLSEIANIEPFTPHSFRHYFATRLIKAGVPLVIVSKILGHSSAQFTEQIYVHIIPSDYRGATDVLGF